MPTKFVLAGVKYEHADTSRIWRLGVFAGSRTARSRRSSPKCHWSAAGPLRFTATRRHYNSEWVGVDWNDDNIQNFNCWMPAADVRRPADGEWHGNYVAR